MESNKKALKREQKLIIIKGAFLFFMLVFNLPLLAYGIYLSRLKKVALIITFVILSFYLLVKITELIVIKNRKIGIFWFLLKSAILSSLYYFVIKFCNMPLVIITSITLTLISVVVSSLLINFKLLKS